MLTLITISICLFIIVLTVWTLSTYFIKKDSQKLIREEVKNLFNACKQLFESLINLIGVLTSHSISNESIEEDQVKKTILNEDEQLLSLIQPVREMETPSLDIENEEDTDTALSSFSPEVVEVINEEEEKVA